MTSPFLYLRTDILSKKTVYMKSKVWLAFKYLPSATRRRKEEAFHYKAIKMRKPAEAGSAETSEKRSS